MIRLALLPLFVGICFCRVGKDKSVREAERRDTDEKTGRLPQIEEKHNTKRAGVSAIACSVDSMKYICKRFSVMIISYDKMNQLRHVRFLKNKEGVLAHMAKHRRRLIPCFDETCAHHVHSRLFPKY